MIRRCHRFDCVPAHTRKFFFCHPLSLCVKGSRAAAKITKAEVTVVPNDCFQFTEECPFAKMLVPESSVLRVAVVIVPK